MEPVVTEVTNKTWTLLAAWKSLSESSFCWTKLLERPQHCKWYTMKSLIVSMKSRFRTKRVAWNLTEWHLLGGGGGGRRGKDVCNHDVHFCRKASLPDKCNALQTWPRWDRLTELFTARMSFAMICRQSEMLMLLVPRGERESQTQMAFQFKHLQTLPSVASLEELPELSQWLSDCHLRLLKAQSSCKSRLILVSCFMSWWWWWWWWWWKWQCWW